MARNEIDIAVPPEDVFAVLSNARSYSHWVVGSREVRAVDATWPDRGSAFDHTVGTGPFGLKDHTYVEQVDPPFLLRLRARARPFPSARVTLSLEPAGEGTHVTMVEDPAFPLGPTLIGPLGHVAIKLRNAESLKRLKRLAEGQTSVPDGELSAREPGGTPSGGRRAAARLAGGSD